MTIQLDQELKNTSGDLESTVSSKEAAQDLRKVFIAPQLTLRGDLSQVTAGTFGNFSPHI